MTTIGKIASSDETQEKWETYVEHVEQFFNIDGDHQVPTLLSLIGGKTYALLRDLLTPKKPAAKSFQEIVGLEFPIKGNFPLLKKSCIIVWDSLKTACTYCPSCGAKAKYALGFRFRAFKVFFYFPQEIFSFW